MNHGRDRRRAASPLRFDFFFLSLMMIFPQVTSSVLAAEWTVDGSLSAQQTHTEDIRAGITADHKENDNV